MKKTPNGSRRSRSRRPDAAAPRRSSTAASPAPGADPVAGAAPPDPHAAREAERYEHPIASREAILALLDAADGPLNFAGIAASVGITPDDEDQVEALRRRLRAMERDGQLLCNRRGGYAPVQRIELIAGRVIGHADGFGFLVPDAGGEDLFLGAREMRRVLHGDRVLARQSGVDRRGRPEGTVVEILERANREVVGRFMEDSGITFVVPDNKRIHQDVLIPREHVGEARAGQIVVAEILEQPDFHRQPIGRIHEVLGDYRAPGLEVEIAIRSHGLPHVFPDEVLAAAEAFGDSVPESAKHDRLDVRDLPLVTIDGEDARDFDDAVYAERSARGWRLLVAIADVSWYVRPGDTLDVEAAARGTSVYFPDRAIPMLPEALSNGLCSLNPQVDRLALICELEVTARGRVKSATFHEGLIRSAARLTYTEVAAILGGDAERRIAHSPLVPHLENLHAIYQLFAARRAERGAIDFETVETRVVFGDQGRIERIEPRERNVAHRIIEECMLAANVAAASALEESELPAIYRVHDKPSAERVDDLRRVLGELGLYLPGGEVPKPADYSTLLAQVRERPDAEFVQTLLLRSLRLAVYQPENGGHFGLSYEAYTHFTSPIRRYPDLLVHRALKRLISPQRRGGYPYEYVDLERLAEHCSMTERRADEASRDAMAWLKCEFMQSRVGEVFSGRVTGVTGFGLFITLDELHVEGLVHITGLGEDYYQHDAAGHRLVGERSGRVFRLSMPLTVKVMRVDLDERRIDFDLAGLPEPEGRARKRRRRN
jgi:ribonuclease R